MHLIFALVGWIYSTWNNQLFEINRNAEMRNFKVEMRTSDGETAIQNLNVFSPFWIVHIRAMSYQSFRETINVIVLSLARYSLWNGIFFEMAFSIMFIVSYHFQSGIFRHKMLGTMSVFHSVSTNSNVQND